MLASSPVLTNDPPKIILCNPSKQGVLKSSYIGWILKPSSVEFWLDGDNRIHERLKYSLDENNNWVKKLLSP